MLWAKLVRSPYARTNVVDVDASDGKNLRGVADVIWHKDVPQTHFVESTIDEPAEELGIHRGVRFSGLAVTHNKFLAAISDLKADYPQYLKQPHKPSMTCKPPQWRIRIGRDLSAALTPPPFN